jgi:hypothetical protein
MVPTWAISSFEVTLVLSARHGLDRRSMPREVHWVHAAANRQRLLDDRGGEHGRVVVLSPAMSEV